MSQYSQKRSSLEQRLRQKEGKHLRSSSLMTSQASNSQTQRPETESQSGSNRLTCKRFHLRPSDQTSLDPGSLLSFETLLRDFVIQWGLVVEDPSTLGALLTHYGRLILQEDKTLFREVLDQMIEEKREQGDSHE